MPEETRYVTLSGNPPNGGFPPGQMFASVVVEQQPVTQPEYYGPPPAYNLPLPTDFPAWYQGPPPPAPAAPAAPLSNPCWCETQGQHAGGNAPNEDGWSLLMPSDLVSFLFVENGLRPCDAPNGHYPHQFVFTKYKAPSVMTVADLLTKIKAPPGDHIGITEMEELGDDRFTAGITITRGSELAKKTLAEIGWTQRKSEIAPIWLAPKW